MIYIYIYIFIYIYIERERGQRESVVWCLVCHQTRWHVLSMQIFSELLTRSSLHWDNFLASCMERERNTTKIQAYSQLTCICWLAQRLGWPTQGLATSTFQQNVHCSWKIICDQNICVSLFLPFCLHSFDWAVMAAKWQYHMIYYLRHCQGDQG